MSSTTDMYDEIGGVKGRGTDLSNKFRRRKASTILKNPTYQLYVRITRFTLRHDVLALSQEDLKEYIRCIHNHYTFVLANIGFTRTAKIFLALFQPYKKSIVLVLNPLDSLGDNQVCVDEKKSVGVAYKKISAINLKKNILDAATAERIISGFYEFIYIDGTPLLFDVCNLSSNCNKENLRIVEAYQNEMAEFIQGELPWTEIHILRINIKNSLDSSDDLSNLYSAQKQTPYSEIVPKLIYETTRNLTKQVLDVLKLAHDSKKGHTKPFSTFEDITGYFTKGIFPIVSATMALGLGQNWKRIQFFMHLGQGDPASIFQMLGHCGRDGKKRPCSDFQNNIDRLDSMAITPVFLKISFSIDDLLGYIPLSVENPKYQKRSLICQWVMYNFKKVTLKNFNSFISHSPQDIDHLDSQSSFLG
ncbi:hypothetical protein VP01_249g11 [Puccinia sorghi]|uniref:DNA 3'-5' helicase n=1 Tax=Puccinia sorghi TaxID=27349 RepID=A0A0L6V5L7_9BASI|nr:hypothetical protein VP01_249g11 [Puccinia sorghi]